MPQNVLDAVGTVQVERVQLEDAEVESAGVGGDNVDQHWLRQNSGNVATVNVPIGKINI